MSDFFKGFVLRGAKTSPTNATTSAPADSGVARDVTTLDPFLYPTGQPALVEARADQYRSAILNSPTASEQEFLVWAANTGTLTTLEGPQWAISDGAGTIPSGTIAVLDSASPTGRDSDGSSRVVVTDNGGRDIAGIVSIGVLRGGSPTLYTLTLAGGDFSFTPGSGNVTLLPTPNTLAATNPVSPTSPALSRTRGDQVVSVSYWISGIRFWWTRNDAYSRRFGWNGATQKWEPYKGGPPTNLGPLSTGSVVLSPLPSTPRGVLLPGSSAGDAYASLRLGASPDAGSYPIVGRSVGDFSGVLVVPNELASTDYNFGSTSPPLAGVIGETSGKIAWNPAFVQAYEGSSVWYIPRVFAEKSDGVLGKLADASTHAFFLAPVPGPNERPIVRLGNREPLLARSFDTEAALASAVIAEGEVGFSISTGKIKLSSADITKADPGTRASPNPLFNKLYLGAVIRYDGVTLNAFPQPLKAPVLLVNSSGVPVTSFDPANPVFVPDSATLPGLGLSGILAVPDGVGNHPVPGVPTARPGNTGLVRALSSGIGDVILFTAGRSVTRTLPVSFDDELPTDPFRVPGDVAYVSLQKTPGAGSRVFFGSVPRKDLTGKPVYFRQAEFVPALYADRCRLVSRIQDSFTFLGIEVLNFQIGLTSVLWTAPAGTFSATAVAASLNAAIVLAGAPGSSYELSGRVVLAASDTVSGVVGVGFGYGGVSHLEACTALGLLPGWVSTTATDRGATDPNWIADYGGEFGFYRSPRDLDGSQPIPDYQDKFRLSNATLSNSISAVPFQFLNFGPREDIAGYDLGIFFSLTAAGAPGVAPVLGTQLQPWEDVEYLFQDKKFAWLSVGGATAKVEAPIGSINLGSAGVVPETLIAQLNGFLRLSSGGPFEYLDLGSDFLLTKGGATGEAVLISRVNEFLASGARGHFSAGGNVLTYVSVNFTTETVAAGDRLKLVSGNAQGSYAIGAVPSTTTLRVSPSFLEGDGGVNVSYEIFRGVAPGNIDSSIVADVLYKNFNHLAEEPFEIRILAKLGIAGSLLANADAAKDIQRKRPIFVRVSQTGSDIPLTILARKELGVAANSTLFVPTAGVRFTSGAFNLRVGTTEFVQGTSLLPVAVFSPDPGSTIEYLTSTGELKFGSAVLANYASATVTYVETLLSASNLVMGEAEIDPDTGAVALSSSDLILGLPVYFVEQLSVEGTDDATVNPILGAFTFLANPIRPFQLVEVTYFRAVPNTGELFLDSNNRPVQIKEFLPLFIRAEVATRISSQLYSFNPTGRTTDALVPPVVYTDSVQQTYGVPPGCTVDFATNRISLRDEVPDSTKVTISYAVFEAFGGETSYTASTPPVWRPPFRFDKGQSVFLLDSNRLADMVPGKALRVGAFTTYVKTATYDSTSNTTTVTVFPAPTTGVGSLNPGANALSLLSDRPVAIVVDPFGPTPTPIANSDPGFLPTIAFAFGLSSTPRFEPIAPGQLDVKFEGDLTRYAVAGHLLELNGLPFAIVKGELSTDGRTTSITVASPFPTSIAWSATMPDAGARISVRPVYPEGATQFLGTSAFLATEPFEVVLFGETDASGNTLPGRTLVSGRDYTANESNGNIAFLQPRQPGIASGQKLVFSRTDAKTIGPFNYKGSVQYPRLSSGFRFVDPPSVTNGRLGGVLQATYTFESPDSFYVRAAPFLTYVGEVATDLQKQATASEPANGPTVSTVPSKKNDDYGRAGLVSERSNLFDRDRVARVFLGFYNAATSSFEQIEETLDGSLVGERDGKLRFYIGKDDPWTPPGFEDEITGVLNPRVLWFDAWSSARRGLPTIRLLTTDPVTDPLNTTTDSNGRPIGSYQDPSAFEALASYQGALSKNDVDDVAILSRTNVQRLLNGFITFRVVAFGQFAGQSEASPFSRLFPERTEGFTTLGPGLDGNESTGAPGSYTAGRFGFDPLGFLFGAPFSVRSTTGSTIGQLENPVLGPLQNVLGVKARDRLARARIWSYSPTGYPSIDPASAGRPSIIATPLALIDFPISANTGLPDTTKLASQSLTPTPTGANDLLTGDPTLHTPPFASGMQLALGFPAGNSTELGYSGTLIPVGSSSRYAGVFVDAVLKGCVVTLKSKNLAGGDVPISDPTLVLALTGPAAGTPFAPERGDTLFVVPGTGSVLPATADPPTISQLQSFTATLPTYRTGTDLNYTARTGELTDATQPSFADPTLFGLKEITGQRPPPPLATIEADVRFQNGNRLPTRFPALNGGKTLDSGDYSLPYYGSPINELELLGTAASSIVDLNLADSPDPPPPLPSPFVQPYATEAVYPDETLDSAGVVARTPAQMATLATVRNLLRGSSSGAYPPPPGHAGVGDVGAFDLLLVQAPTTGVPGPDGFPLGSTGIHSIADITFGAPNQIDLPRFASPVNAEFSRFSYTVENAIAWVGFPAYATGIVVKEDTTLAPIETTFDVASVGPTAIVFDNGTGGGLLPVPIGGLNDIFGTNGKGSQIRVRLIDKTTGQFVPGSNVIVRKTSEGPDILTSSFEASGNDGSTFVPVSLGGFYFLPDKIVVKTLVGFFNFGPFNPVIGPPGVTTTGGFHDFAISVLSYVSRHAGIDPDRLTFRERIDFRTALPRGFTHPSFPTGSLMQCELETREYTASVLDTTTFTLATVDSTNNSIGYVNAGTRFTFPARSSISGSVNGVGTFASNSGTLRVLGFEGRGNVPIDATGITFTAIPSSRQSETGPIFEGSMFVGEILGPGAPFTVLDLNCFTPFVNYAGGLDQIQAGDVAFVRGAFNPSLSLPSEIGSGKTGTYLVRAAVKATTPGPGRRLDLAVTAGSTGGWFDFTFPTVLSFDGVNLSVTSLLPLTPLQDVSANPILSTHAFPNSGRVYLVLDTTAVGVAGSAVSAAYAGLDSIGNRFLTLSGFQDAVGGAITLAQFTAAALAGTRVSGMTILPVLPYNPDVPPNLSGLTVWPTPPPGGEFYFGFRTVAASRPPFGSVTYDASAGTIIGLSPGPGQLAVYSKRKVASTTFLQLDIPVYNNIAGGLDVSNFAWATLHGAGPTCLYPGDLFNLRYHARNGIFVEPSFPISGNNLAAPRVNVVDATHNLTAPEIGTRDVLGYLSPSAPVGGSYLEYAQVEVRRIRRFHLVLDLLIAALERLRFVYEIRRGIVQSFTPSGSSGLLTALPVDTETPPQPLPGGGATQLGDFTLPDIGIRSGDMVRFLNATGAVIAEAEISVVETDGKTLALSKNALPIVPGTRFEIYLRSAPIPQEQSNEELLALAIDRLLLDRRADLVAQSGGKVNYLPNPDPQVAYDQSINVLSDTDPSVNFVTLGVAKGDVILIDPAGPLRGPTGFPPTPESGTRPFGDEGVITRGAGLYTPGTPQRTDDNRGYYKVSEVSPTQLHVVPYGGTLAGNHTTGDVLFADNPLDQYAVYPTVHGSNLSGIGNGREGQMDLRPTAFANASNSFKGGWLSIAPFSYRVFRGSSFLSEKTIELILATRERMLSWMEELRAIFTAHKSGSYFVFQRDQFIADIGDTSDPSAGSGVIFDAYLTEIEGRTLVSPFSNTSGCLSILDRRFWGLDFRLDSLHPPFRPLAPPYSDFAGGVGRPVLPDRIEEALQQRDRLRDSRWAWLALRTDTVSGTLAAIRRFDAELPRRQAEQERLLAAVKGTENV